jgi:DNA polymerase III alpha subunit
LDRFCNSVQQGATAGRVAGTVVARAERRTKTGNKMGILEFSDPSGHYEAVIFQEGLMQYRDLLEPGKAVLLMLTAEAQGEDVRARIQNRRTARCRGGEAAEGPARVSQLASADRQRRQAARAGAGRACPIRERQGRCRDHDGADARQGHPTSR